MAPSFSFDLPPIHAICVYAEPLCDGRRVACVGDSSIGLGARLLAQGARSVHLYDPEPARAHREAARAAPGTTVHVLHDPAVDLRGASFDLAIIPDLVAIRPRAELLAALRGALGFRGALLVGAANPDVERAPGAIEYARLYDLVSSEFECVRMIAQLPFLGIAIAELGGEDEEPQVSVETQLAKEGAAPHFYFALASQGDVALDPYAIVQLPETKVPAVDPERASLIEAHLRAQLLEAQLEDSRAKSAHVTRNEAGEARVAELTSKVTTLEAALGRNDAKIRERDAEIALRRAEVLAKDAELAKRASELAARDAELSKRAAALGAKDAELARLASDLASATSAKQASVTEEAEEASDVARLEELLAERGKKVSELEAEITRRARMVQDLVLELEAAGTLGAPSGLDAAPELRAKLDVLAFELARREGDGHALRWKISELEELRPDETPDEALAAARAEQGALRQALAQEHAARRKADSGEALRGAQAEVARQAVLLQQLSHELEQRDRPRHSDLHGKDAQG